MAHVVVVDARPTDPRPFLGPDETGIEHQARCTECGWLGPVHQDEESEHQARADAERHEDET